MDNILEIVRFKTRDGVTAEQFIEANQPLNQWLKTLEGFDYRALSQGEDGSWTDSVFWKNIETAQAAGAEFVERPETQQVMQMIDQESLQMEHQPLHIMEMGGQHEQKRAAAGSWTV